LREENFYNFYNEYTFDKGFGIRKDRVRYTIVTKEVI
jgi:hypothetical protein